MGYVVAQAMSKRKSKCKTSIKRDRGMWMVVCTQHGLKHLNGGMQWYHDKNQAREFIKEHEARYACNT